MMYSVLLVLALAAQGYARPNCFFACDYPVGQVPYPSYPGYPGQSGSLVQPGYPGVQQPGYPPAGGSLVQPGYPGVQQPGYPPAGGSLVQPGYPGVQQPGYPPASGNLVQPPNSMVEIIGQGYPPRQGARVESFQPSAGGHLSFNHESQASHKTSISGSYHFPASAPPMNERLYQPPQQRPCRVYSDCP